MDYNALIQNRKSARQFTDKKVGEAVCAELEGYYQNSCQRLVPDIATELWIFGDNTRQALEGAAGYNEYLVGAPQYLVLLSEKAELAYENAGYMMEDLVLKLEDMGLGSCWLTFTDSKAVKAALGIDSPLEVAAIAAFGYPQKARKRMRFNILSMSNVDIGGLLRRVPVSQLLKPSGLWLCDFRRSGGAGQPSRRVQYGNRRQAEPRRCHAPLCRRGLRLGG